MENTPNRLYKSRLFVMIFEDKEKLLELYNAVSGSDYRDPGLLEINTLENAIYMSMKNDISFLIDARLSLYEHQSTYSPNLPLRFLFYLSDLYSGMTRDANLYGTKKVQIPPPRCIVFYNGEGDQPDRRILKLSDLYTVEEEEHKLELEALMLNVNTGHNEELLNACRTLGEYAAYTGRVRRYVKEMPIEEAVEQAITECIREGILKDFLEKNRREAIRVSIYEYDEERHIRQEREDAWEEGRQEGERIGREEGERIGLEKGRQEGERSGLEKGRQESRQRIVKNMLKQKKTEEEIALLTGEPEETIRELIEQIRSEVPEGDADRRSSGAGDYRVHSGRDSERFPGEEPKGGDTGEHLRI